MPCFREVLETIGSTHFNTLKHLMIHLQKVAQRSKDTGMSSKNLAIVWAPNLIKTSLSSKGILNILLNKSPEKVMILEVHELQKLAYL